WQVIVAGLICTALLVGVLVMVVRNIAI
ncbi:MAG: DUF2970 domain-containing protein, partial [Burkholderiales bacterium]|nr:DUF2970 domain-containing protein [Burkholderiales bacterium]